MPAFRSSGMDLRRARIGYRAATGLVLALFLAALVVYTYHSHGVRSLYWTLLRVAAALLG